MRIQSCKQPAYSHNRLALNCISNVTRASAIQNDIPMRLYRRRSNFANYSTTIHDDSSLVPFRPIARNRVEDIQGTKITKSRKWRNNYLQ